MDRVCTTDGRGGPDGAVVDAAGLSLERPVGRIVRGSARARRQRRQDRRSYPSASRACPAFGGKDYKTLFITTAREHMTPEQLENEPTAGSVFAIELDVPGLPEPLFKL